MVMGIVAVVGLLVAAAPGIDGQFDSIPTHQAYVVPDLSLCAYVRMSDGAPVLSLCCHQRGGTFVEPSVCLTDCILEFEESDTTLKRWTCPLAGGAKYTTVDYALAPPPTTSSPPPAGSPSTTKFVPPSATKEAPIPSTTRDLPLPSQAVSKLSTETPSISHASTSIQAPPTSSSAPRPTPQISSNGIESTNVSDAPTTKEISLVEGQQSSTPTTTEGHSQA
ncbi:hypothetical protein H310_09326 [Aphanomyces invadans]|uniref:Uncharacterized protein n=1 Tax=Aphanomyces invadans TaxID=157072 RepID=A0A024TV33_9STRA|nr:hypothetical protein H310_09326 [Aphanomyces invadans]ETV98030.1 hypothetical protein H310_09326 [Aphanomyces invadans]|eukprot:XP_008873591.1 hypothetical protein H310_09326 [Aphanomyces invadans]